MWNFCAKNEEKNLKKPRKKLKKFCIFFSKISEKMVKKYGNLLKNPPEFCPKIASNVVPRVLMPPEPIVGRTGLGRRLGTPDAVREFICTFFQNFKILKKMCFFDKFLYIFGGEMIRGRTSEDRASALPESVFSDFLEAAFLKI